jgi:hypothetical protein
MKVLFVTPGPIEWATSRFRAHWLQPYFEDSKIMLYEGLMAMDMDVRTPVITEHIQPTHVVWLKQCDPRTVKILKKDFGIVSIWDVTDPMWWFSPEPSWEINKAVDGVITSSRGLAEDYGIWCGRSATPIDDHMNLEHYGNPRPPHEGVATKLIWYGHSNNRMTLFGVMTSLSRLIANGYKFSLTIMDDRGDEVKFFHGVTRLKFDLKREAEILKEHDIAILPPYPGDWGKVKSNNKQLTAYACGLAVTTGLSYTRLRDLVKLPDKRNAQRLANRKMVEEGYTSRHGAYKLRQYLERFS